MTCPQCNKNKLRVRLAKTNGNLFAACSGFPSCKNTMSMPKGISSLKMLEENCPKCLKRDKKEVKLFHLEFDSVLVNEIMAEFLPDQDNTAGTFCMFVGCDTAYKTLCEETHSLPNKKTFGGDQSSQPVNPNGIPPYYYQKPEVTSVANGGGPDKRVKKDAS